MDCKKMIHLEVSTWMGTSSDASHYYGRLVGNDHVNEYTAIELKRKCTKKDAIEENKKEVGFSAFRIRPGSLTTGFGSIGALRRAAIKCWKEYFPQGKILIEGSATIAEPQRVIDGPKKIKDTINRLTKRSEESGGWDVNEDKMEKICDKWTAIVGKL